MLSLSQLMQFFILCNFLPLVWKTNTSLLSKNILQHCQQLSTQSKTTITTQCECTIEAAFLVQQIFKELLRTARKIIQVTERKGCFITAKRMLLCHHKTQPNVQPEGRNEDCSLTAVKALSSNASPGYADPTPCQSWSPPSAANRTTTQRQA